MTEQDKYIEKLLEYQKSKLQSIITYSDVRELLQTTLDDKGEACEKVLTDYYYDNIDNGVPAGMIELASLIRNAIPQLKEVEITDDERRRDEYQAEHDTLNNLYYSTWK
ncbi:MAG: hypothetical protein A2Z57_03370 [Planctomycetes bacterium RIFCSPHIGHO2_12_39_6]|nr:MAG: hypothetical protein A2Z57_03370 [Planctomycetes bacterium RIFCSPHIGHO2_12_39_6]